MKNVRIQPDVYRAMKEAAANAERTIQAQINLALREWLKQQEQQKNDAS